jgi:hypothetical protein
MTLPNLFKNLTFFKTIIEQFISLRNKFDRRKEQIPTMVNPLKNDRL